MRRARLFYVIVREIAAKTLLSRIRGIDTYFGLDYAMNLYRGCQHRCIYCDSRSKCYGIDEFDREVLVKANAIERLHDELPRKRRRGIIGTGSMNDPYMPLERDVELTRRALVAIAQYGFGVHIVTKSDLVVRDIDVLEKIARTNSAAVSLTVTTMDDGLARRVEPGAPPTSVRLQTLEVLAQHGIETRIALMPILPFLEDTKENVVGIVEAGRRVGVRAIVPWFGMSLRDRQRAYFYARLDEAFPGLRARYQTAFGQDYMCPSPRAEELARAFHRLCASYGIDTAVKPALAPTAAQKELFGNAV